nr:hypothetical protein [Micromonospora sp. DSM 115978]
MSAWAVVIPSGRYEAERLFHHDTLELAGLGTRHRPAPGDEVLVVREDQRPLVVALGRVGAGPATSADGTGAALVVTYTRRAFDEPAPADRLALDGPVTPVDPATYRELAGQVGPPADRRTYLVSVDLPIEASSQAEAVRLFWSYVRELGPQELPAFVWPSGDELAMQAYVLGAEANQDPEEDDD